MSADRFPVNFSARPGLQPRCQKVCVDTQIILLSELDNFAEQCVAAVHWRRRSQHDPRVSTSATEMRQHGKYFLLPGFSLCSRVSSLRGLRCQTDRILITQ